MSKRIEKGFKDFTSQESLDAIWKDSDKEDFCGNVRAKSNWMSNQLIDETDDNSDNSSSLHDENT